jgi:DNA-binding PadR family transcriptional regulator
MAQVIRDGDHIILSKLDTRILVGLLRGPMSAYEIARQCEDDAQDLLKLSDGSVRPALAGLRKTMLVTTVPEHRAFRTSAAHHRRIYDITSLGRQALAWEIDALSLLMHWATQRGLEPNTKQDSANEVLLWPE